MSAKMSNPKIPTRSHGIRWSDSMYLTSTSEIDGRRRWQEIILLLASKLQTNDESDPMNELGTLLSTDLDPKAK